MHSLIAALPQVQAVLADARKVLLLPLSGNWTLGYRMASAVVGVSDAVENVQRRLDQVLADAEYAPINALYVDVKSGACCEAGNFAFVQWLCMTVSGECLASRTLDHTLDAWVRWGGPAADLVGAS